MSATSTSMAPRCVSEDEGYIRLETRVLNRVARWDAKSENRRHHVVELLRNRMDALEAWAPDGKLPDDPTLRRLCVSYREEMYPYRAELDAVRARDDA